jgi:hypothetical protein
LHKKRTSQEKQSPKQRCSANSIFEIKRPASRVENEEAAETGENSRELMK